MDNSFLMKECKVVSKEWSYPSFGDLWLYGCGYRIPKVWNHLSTISSVFNDASTILQFFKDWIYSDSKRHEENDFYALYIMFFKISGPSSGSFLSHQSYLAGVCSSCSTSIRNFDRCGRPFYLESLECLYITCIDDGGHLLPISTLLPSRIGFLPGRTAHWHFLFFYGENISHGGVSACLCRPDCPPSGPFFLKKVGEGSIPVIFSNLCLYQLGSFLKIFAKGDLNQ